MSVSLVLLPFALALAPVRLVMGKERFDAWLRSGQVRIPTTFRDEKDLLMTVQKAGFDAERWGGRIKTHVRDRELFLFWEHVGGRWVAVLSKSDSELEVERFMDELERRTGRQLFSRASDAQRLEGAGETYPTNIRDEQLLRQAVAALSWRPVDRPDGSIACQTDTGDQLLFRREEGGVFEAVALSSSNAAAVGASLSVLNSTYCDHVQSQVCDRIRTRAVVQGLIIESEEVLDDQSVVITLTVEG